MRKVYVVLGTSKQTNQTWIVGVYTSQKKACAAKLVNILNDYASNKYEIKTEVLI